MPAMLPRNATLAKTPLLPHAAPCPQISGDGAAHWLAITIHSPAAPISKPPPTAAPQPPKSPPSSADLPRR